MKNKRNANDTQRGNTLPIPDIDIIDLENDGAAEASAEPASEDAHPAAAGKKGKKNDIT